MDTLEDEKLDNIMRECFLCASRTMTGGDSYQQCNIIMSNSDLIALISDSEKCPPICIDVLNNGSIKIQSVNMYKAMYLPEEVEQDPEIWVTFETRVKERILVDTDHSGIKIESRIMDLIAHHEEKLSFVIHT